jgi:hypothetical protein
VQADDDTICEISVAELVNQKFTVADGSSDTEQWFFADLEKARESSVIVKRDFLATYERVLGRPLLSVAADRFNSGQTANLANLSPDLLHKTEKSPIRIAITQFGSVGDSGKSENDNLFRLLSHGPTHDRLVQSDDYRQDLNSRFIRRSPKNLNIGTSFPCVAMNLGLDGRVLLPPFPPVQRNEDGVFSLLFDLCCLDLCGSHLPEAILHVPPESRSHANFISDTSMIPYHVRTGDLLEMLLRGVRTKVTGEESSTRIKSIGRALLNIAHSSKESFVRRLNREVMETVKHLVDKSRSLIRAYPDSPAVWHKDMKSLIEGLQEASLQSDLFLPVDIEGTAEQKVERLRCLTEKWANLLLYWPAIHDAARDLQDGDIRPSSLI